MVDGRGQSRINKRVKKGEKSGGLGSETCLPYKKKTGLNV